MKDQKMAKLVNLLFIFIFILITGSKLMSKETKSPEYLKYVDEIVSDFVKEMEKKHHLECYGSGGSMPNDVEKIEVLFNACRKATVDDARKIEVDAIQELLKRINTHEKIRPYLREYPFDSNRVGISITFLTKKGDRPLDGSVAFVFLAKNKIFYDAAAIQIKEPTTRISMNKKNEVVKKLVGGGPKVELIDLMNEPYEEALKIVGITSQPTKDNNDSNLKDGITKTAQ
jgi:hypothetical protein